MVTSSTINAPHTSSDGKKDISVNQDSALIQCDSCTNRVAVDLSDIVLEHVSTEERHMGPEHWYEGRIELRCDACGAVLTVGYEESEYPEGVTNYQKTRALAGGHFLSLTGDAISTFADRLYALDTQSGLLLPESREIVTEVEQGAAKLLLAAHRDPDILFKADPRAFEELVAYIFEQHGFQVELTARTRDGGRDIIALQMDALGVSLKYLIECKRYAKHRKVSVDLVRALYGVHQAEGANKSVLVTTSSFSSDATAFSQRQNTTAQQMSLVDFKQLQDWVAKTVKKRPW